MQIVVDFLVLYVVCDRWMLTCMVPSEGRNDNRWEASKHLEMPMCNFKPISTASKIKNMRGIWFLQVVQERLYESC